MGILRQHGRFFASLSALAVILAASLLAEQQAIRSRSDLVEVYVTVTARNGAGVYDLRGDEFEVFEDGQKRPIVAFSTAVQPLSIAIVLDHSGSTDADFNSVLQASQDFVGRLFKEDRAAVSSLSWDCVPFTGDFLTVQALLRNRLPRDAGSPIWSATDRAMSALAAEPGRRIILLFSDGEDNQSMLLQAPKPPEPPRANFAHPCSVADISVPRSLADVSERAERDSVMVYGVAVGGNEMGAPNVLGSPTSQGTGSPIGTTSDSPEPGGVRDLAKLARRSGASMHRLKNYSQVSAAFKSILNELHLQYLLGFTPTAFDGKRHDITVKVKREGVNVRAREAYVASKR
jgi:VWFA-related protein